MKKTVSQNSEQNPASVAVPSKKPESSWTEGDISFRKGNCNVLLIAPHGHPDNDGRTYSITRKMAESVDSYAIVNKTYRKPPFIKNDDGTYYLDEYEKRVRHDPDKSEKWINLNRKNQVHKYLKSEFEVPLLSTINVIIKEYGKALVLWIHGMNDKNLTPNNTEGNLPGMDALLGIGQGNSGNLTAKKKTVDKLIAALKSNTIKPINAALAKRGSDYCGWHKNIMNQFFVGKKYSLDKVESIQIEIRRKGFRETANYKNTAKALSDAISKMAIRQDTESEQIDLDSADQIGTIQQIQVDEIDLENGQFKSRLDKIASATTEFKRLVDSIKRHGILNPVIVRRRGDTDGKPYQLISGFRRMAAFRDSIAEKDFDSATVPARVLHDFVSDDEAYQISFTENLARQDLSLWEIAQACAKIKERKIAEGDMSRGQIEKHLAELIQKDARTVRRYLRLSSIENEDITEAVHTGFITPTTALDIGKKDLDEDDIADLLVHIKKFPKTTRSFVRFYGNLEMCCRLSKLSVSKVLNCPNADKFLSLDQKELITRIEHRRKGSGLTPMEIIQGKAGSLVKAVDAMDSEVAKKSLQYSFNKAAEPLSKKVFKGFKDSKIDARFKIKPLQKDIVSVTISATIGELQSSVDIVSKEIGNGLKQIKTVLKK